MTTIDPRTTLADLVTVHPELARVLEAQHLDYCCHGGQSLSEACGAAGLDTDDVLAALQAAAAPPSVPEWAGLDAVGLAAHLETTHHRFLWDELPRLAALAEKVHSVHGERHPELAQVVASFTELRTDLEVHLTKEERVLFPLIRRLASGDSVAGHCGTIRNPIGVMWQEHDRAGDLLADLRRSTDGYRVPDDGCASYRLLYEGLEHLEHDLHTHIMKENSHLFPKAVELESMVSQRDGQ